MSESREHVPTDTRSESLMGVQERMTEEERQKFLERMTGRNPHLRGAHVADVLDMLYEQDAFLALAEPFYEAYEPLFTEENRWSLFYAIEAAVVLLEEEERASEPPHKVPPDAMLPLVMRLAGVRAMSFRCEVIADDSGTWAGNGLRFATVEEARAYVNDLAWRWTLVREARVTVGDEPVNARWADGRLVDVKFCDQCGEYHEPPVSQRGVDGPDCPRWEARQAAVGS
jgi:hypothetical protein